MTTPYTEDVFSRAKNRVEILIQRPVLSVELETGAHARGTHKHTVTVEPQTKHRSIQKEKPKGSREPLGGEKKVLHVGSGSVQNHVCSGRVQK